MRLLNFSDIRSDQPVKYPLDQKMEYPEISVRFSDEDQKLTARIFGHVVAEVWIYRSVHDLNNKIASLDLHPFLDFRFGTVAWFEYLAIPIKFKGKGYGGKVVSKVFSQLKKTEVRAVYAHAETKESEAICEKLGAVRLPLKDKKFWLPTFKKELEK